MCPEVSPTYSCICARSFLRNSVSRSARSQNSLPKVVATSCHFVPSLATGAGDSSDSNCIVFSIRLLLTLTVPRS